MALRVDIQRMSSGITIRDLLIYEFGERRTRRWERLRKDPLIESMYEQSLAAVTAFWRDTCDLSSPPRYDDDEGADDDDGAEDDAPPSDA